ncbi:MAG: Type II secretion system protein [uncultured Sulfurovum sp.]|uniref:Type II secretion system protein n=1 Tax=uncultured Sulfurovum sp. TaxID=269237 RepID=A0A6S6U6U9_9BACT|nr:MAG: Type II secretion system protein [uncultured Sulfurovum sp.]
MKYFKITILSKGKKRLETIQAKSKIEAIRLTKKKYPGVAVQKSVEIAAPMGSSFDNIFVDLKNSFERKIDINNKIAAIRQIAVMTDAGISIHDAISEVAANAENPKLKKIYQNVASDINAGKSIADSIEPYKEEFGHIAIAMTNLGEKTGNIAGSYDKLANILEDIRDNLKKFKKAIRTPLITFAAMAVAFTILIMVVVPKFKEMFEKFNSALPVPTQILLFLEDILNNYGLYVLAGLALIVFMVLKQYKNNPKFKYKVDKLLVHPKFYLIEKIIFFSTMHKYTLVFGELVKSGIPVSEALDTAIDMVENAYIKEKLLSVNANIARGISLSDAFEQTGLFENMLLQMIRAGETGGQLDAMLGKVTEYYDSRFQDLIDNLAAYIEPIMLFFIAGLVLLMALGIFMPMWDLGKAVK